MGEAPRTDDQGEPRPDLPTRPAYACGSLNLSVPPLSRTLALTATLADTELAPGGETNVGPDWSRTPTVSLCKMPSWPSWSWTRPSSR